MQSVKHWAGREVMDGRTEGGEGSATADATAADREVGRTLGY